MNLTKSEERILGNIVAKAARSKAEAEIVSLLQHKLARFLDEADETLRRDFFTQVTSARRRLQNWSKPAEPRSHKQRTEVSMTSPSRSDR